MSTTYKILSVSGSDGTDTTRAVYGQRSIELSELQPVTTVPKGEGSETLYIHNGPTARPDYPSYVRVGNYPNAKANNGRGSVNASVKFSTWLVSTDSVTGAETIEPLVGTLALTVPGKTAVPNQNQIACFIENLSTVFLPNGSGIDGSGNALATPLLAGLQFGLTNKIV